MQGLLSHAKAEIDDEEEVRKQHLLAIMDMAHLDPRDQQLALLHEQQMEVPRKLYTQVELNTMRSLPAAAQYELPAIEYCMDQRHKGRVAGELQKRYGIGHVAGKIEKRFYDEETHLGLHPLGNQHHSGRQQMHHPDYYMKTPSQHQYGSTGGNTTDFLHNAAQQAVYDSPQFHGGMGPHAGSPGEMVLWLLHLIALIFFKFFFHDSYFCKIISKT